MQKHSTLFSGDLFKEVLSNKIYVEDSISQSDKISPIVKFPWEKVWFGEDKDMHKIDKKEEKGPVVKSPWDKYKDIDRCEVKDKEKESPFVEFPWDKVWFGEDKEKHERRNKNKECPAVKSPWDKDKDRC